MKTEKPRVVNHPTSCILQPQHGSEHREIEKLDKDCFGLINLSKDNGQDCGYTNWTYCSLSTVHNSLLLQYLKLTEANA